MCVYLQLVLNGGELRYEFSWLVALRDGSIMLGELGQRGEHSYITYSNKLITQLR